VFSHIKVRTIAFYTMASKHAPVNTNALKNSSWGAPVQGLSCLDRRSIAFSYETNDCSTEMLLQIDLYLFG
jgi:hypothetical protein